MVSGQSLRDLKKVGIPISETGFFIIQEFYGIHSIYSLNTHLQAKPACRFFFFGLLFSFCQPKKKKVVFRHVQNL